MIHSRAFYFEKFRENCCMSLQDFLEERKFASQSIIGRYITAGILMSINLSVLKSPFFFSIM